MYSDQKHMKIYKRLLQKPKHVLYGKLITIYPYRNYIVQ